MELNFKKIFWGLLFVIIGLLWMLKNTGIIQFSWHDLINLWPLILVFWGISILPIKNKIKIGLLILTFGIGVFVFYQFKNTEDDCFFSWNSENNTKITRLHELKYDSSIQKAVIHFDAAAESINIKDSTNELIEIKGNGGKEKYEMKSYNEGNSTQIDITTKNEHHFWNKNNRKVNLELNTAPTWDINLDVGAASLDFDLSKFKINQIQIEAGASSIKLKLGDLLQNSSISIDAGASSVNLYIPAASGCEIKCDNALSSKNFKDFTKVEDGIYRTSNFESAINKIKIDFDAGVSDINVTRY